MTHRFKKKRPAFVMLPRHKRSNEVMRLKGQIKRDSDKYGGMFTSDVLLDEPCRPDLYKQWFDFYFLGQDRFTFWNVEIVTARRAFWDAVQELAHQRTTAMLTSEELADESKLEFVPADFSSTGKVLTYQLINREKIQYKKFNGLTFSEQLEKMEVDIIRETTPIIHESFRLDRSYVYGIGLSIILDVNIINQAAIEQAITQFRLLNETDWQAAIPVPRERLPVVSEEQAFAAIKVSVPRSKLVDTMARPIKAMIGSVCRLLDLLKQ
jgi:hypothetical protein